MISSMKFQGSWANIRILRGQVALCPLACTGLFGSPFFIDIVREGHKEVNSLFGIGDGIDRAIVDLFKKIAGSLWVRSLHQDTS